MKQNKIILKKEVMESQIERILLKSGGSSENQVKSDIIPFKWLNNSSNFKDFCQWFTEYINDDNCLTADELMEYEKLKAEGLVLAGEDLDKELNEFYEAPPDTLFPFNDIYLTSVQDEMKAVMERKETMKIVQKQLLNDIKKINHELVDTKLAKEAAKKTYNESIKNVITLNKLFCQQLEEVKKQTSEMQDHLLELKDHLTFEGSNSNNTYCPSETTLVTNPSIIRSFDSSIKPLQEQYLLQMNFSKYETLNTSLLESLNLLIRRQLDKPLQNNNRGSGDFVNSSPFIIDFKGITIDLKMELKRLSRSLHLTKQEKLVKEAEVMGMNKAIVYLQQLQNELVVRKWQPALSKMRLDTLDFTHKIEELDMEISHLIPVLSGNCHQWADCLIKKVVQDFTAVKVARKKFLIKIVDELLDTLVTREAYNLLMWILLEQEQNRLIAVANFISEVWSCIAIEVNNLREQKILIESNHHDYLEYLSPPEFERNEVTRMLASLMKTEVDDLNVAADELQNKIKAKEITLLKQYADQVQGLSQMKNFLRTLSCVMFSGPVNKASVVNYKLYSELQEVRERVVELAFTLRSAKHEFLNTQKDVKKDPSKREQQLLWVKALVHPELLKVVKSESPEENE